MNPAEAKFYNKRFEFISRISSILKVLKGFKPFQQSEGLPFAILSYRRCIGCRKKRSLRANSWFEEFPRISLGMLLLCVYYFVCEDTQRKTARRLNMNQGLVSRIFRRLQDVCSMDLVERPVIPIGGPGAAVECDESKFNHKAKVEFYIFSEMTNFVVHLLKLHINIIQNKLYKLVLRKHSS